MQGVYVLEPLLDYIVPVCRACQCWSLWGCGRRDWLQYRLSAAHRQTQLLVLFLFTGHASVGVCGAVAGETGCSTGCRLLLRRLNTRLQVTR
jgi:hypothetical protein